ncbi:hypothetical protein [Arcobacter sp.]|uniref:hypothetical protein n=1 Tax=unclassified Arcobacter TaxID=2593671 RepID=UPI003B00EA98
MSDRSMLSDCFLKDEVIKPQVLGGKKSFKIRQLLISEVEIVEKLMREKKQKEAVHYAVECSMVEPTFFTDEELKKLNSVGQALIFEIYSEIPMIGKSKKEKEDYKKQLEIQIKETAKKQLSEEDIEKK